MLPCQRVQGTRVRPSVEQLNEAVEEREARRDPRSAISAAHSITTGEPHRNIPCLHPLARSVRRRTDRPHFIFFAVAHFAVIAISTRGIILRRVCASVHVDRFAAVERHPRRSPSSLVQTTRSLIKGGVTRVSARQLVG
ncbi:unnamed protein product, partial [Iphiclides podalirius]